MSKCSSGLYLLTKGAKWHRAIHDIEKSKQFDMLYPKFKFTTIENAVQRASKQFIYNEGTGLFGEKGKNTRIIKSENQYKTAKRFYRIISLHGVHKYIPQKYMRMTVLADNTVITYRKYTSTNNSPAVEINIVKSNKIQKIHFIKEK